MSTADTIIAGSKLVLIVAAGGAIYYVWRKASDLTIDTAAAAVDQRDSGTALGAAQSAVSASVQALEAAVRNLQPPKPVQVRQYSFDSTKWGD